MNRIRLRPVSRFALKVACGCFALALVTFVVKLSLARLSASTERHLLTASELAAIFGALTGAAAPLLARWPSRQVRERRPSLISRHLLPDEELVDRVEDMQGLLEQIDLTHVVNCYGQRGSGKSFLLGHLTDVVNGYRARGSGPTLKRVTAALYFDLADAAGFQEVQGQLLLATLGRRDGVWADFIEYVEQEFAHQRILLILDNMNAPGLWPALGKAAHEYRARRPSDKLVFGSIEPVALINLQVHHVELRGLDATATEQLVVARGGQLSAVEVEELHAEYAGLPLYTCLIAARSADSSNGPSVREVENVLDPQFLRGLPSETRRLLSYSSLMALVSRQVAVARLEACPLADVKSELESACRLSLMSPLPEGTGRALKIHDIVRDAVLSALAPEVDEAASFLFERALRQGDDVDAALFAIFAEPEKTGAKQFDEVLGPVIHSAVVSRNHALLTSLHERASRSRRMREFIARDVGRADLFAYGRASELAGLGQYVAAEEALLASSISRERGTYATPSPIQDSLLFLQADIAHLLNRYDEAGDMFEDLGDRACRSGNVSLQARCVWGHGHVLRHQGRDLQQALDLFDAAAALAERSDELFAKTYSLGNACGARLLLDIVRADEEDRLHDLETEVATSSVHDGYLLELWKSRAQLTWYRGDRESALSLVEVAIERALALNDRLLYNLLFERAEYARFRGEHTGALEDYLQVLEFGTGNHDRNLTTNAVLGVVLLELSADRWLQHNTREQARAAVLRARETAIAADIQLTAATAETVTSMLDGPSVDPGSIRLIVL
jgi:tetratricopeptide (TPR) repeat protein